MDGHINMKPVTMPRCEAEWSRRVQSAARRTLRSSAKTFDEFQKSNLDADAIIEQVWNAIVIASGHDKKAAK